MKTPRDRSGPVWRDTAATGGEPDRRSTWSRRQLLVAAGGGAGALLVGGVAGGLAGYEWPHQAAIASRAKNGPAPAVDATANQFVSRPDLSPPRLHLTAHPGAPASPSYIFLAARTYISSETSQSGLMIVDRHGALVWFRPLDDTAPFDFRTQSHAGRPALTWWQGHVTNGYGVGTGQVANTSYKDVVRVSAGNGLRADLHELRLTPAGTALITAYEQTKADLSAVGGPKNGQLLIGHAQEVDLRSGRVLFDWSSRDHVALQESYQGLPSKGPYDYFHINSIAEFPDGDLLVSARNTWALYRVDRSTGRVVWRLNGKKSDFSLGRGASFYWQHDAEPHGTSAGNVLSMSVFDDGASPSEESQSRGLLLDVNLTHERVSLRHAFLHPAGFIAANQGNVQLLADGRVFVGWGNQPYFTEFSPAGDILLDGVMPIGYHSYRAYTADWQGAPSEAPAVAVRPNPAGGAVVYASWNGSTSTLRWTVLAGKHPSDLGAVGSEEKTGFETEIAVNSAGPYYQVVAVGPSGRPLGRSAPVKMSPAGG